MAELNFGLLTPPGSQSIGNAFVTGMDQAAAARAQENQNALSQYTLSKAKREDQVQTAINSAYQGAIGPDGTIDYGAVNRALAAGGAGAKIPEAEAARRKAIADEIDLQIKRGTLNAQPGVAARTLAQTEAAKLAGGKSAQDFRNQGLRDMANNPSDANIVANHEDAVLRGMMTQEESDAQTAKLLAIPLDQRKAIFAQAGAPAAAPVTPTELSKYVSERAAMLPGDPRIANWDAKIAELSTAPAAQRDITNRQGADRIKQGWGQLNVAQRNAATNEARLKLAQEAPKLGLTDPEDIDRVAEAVASGRLPIDRLNGGTASLFAKLLKATPDLDFTKLSVDQAGGRASAVSNARIEARQRLTDVDATQAENIARGNLGPATGPNAGKIMNEVVKLNPDYNSRDFGLQTSAERAFNTGKQGDKTRSLNVAVSHLTTLDTAATALRANSIPALNQFSQAWQRETGKIGPTSFNAIRELVADEIVAAVVPGVGALADRKALKDTIMAKSSPEQLQGVIKQYKELLGGQLGGLEKQYNASTRKTDFRQRYLTPEAVAALTTGQTVTPAGAAPKATNTNPYATKTDAEILRALEAK